MKSAEGAAGAKQQAARKAKEAEAAVYEKAALEAKEFATRTLWHLAGNSEVGEVIAQAGGLAPLVSMLSVDDVHAQVHMPVHMMHMHAHDL